MKLGRKVRQAVTVLLLGMLTAMFLLPMLLTFANSLMSETEIARIYTPLANGDAVVEAAESGREYVSMKWIPDRATLTQYYDVLIG